MVEAPPEPDPAAVMRERRFVGVLVLAAIVGVVASFAAWVFLDLIYQVQKFAYTSLPDDLGYDTVPEWWPLPWLALSGVLVALAVTRLPGRGGHVPAGGLNATPTPLRDLPGVLLAAIASISLGAVIGPEAPLVALGAGIGYLALRWIRPGAPPELTSLIGACGTFAAFSFLFGSPIIAAVLLIEATGLGGKRLPLILIPGLLASGIGMLVSIGLGAWTGVDTSAISFQLLSLPDFARPDFVDFLWTIPFAAVIALVTVAIFRIARTTERIVDPKPLLYLPVIGLAIGGLAIAFSELADKGSNQVLFSGQDALGPLVADAGSWSLSALALLIAFKGVAYAISIGSFRGGPTFPAMFLGAAAGLMAAQLPGFDLTPAVAVGIGAASVAVLRLPLSSIVLAMLLTSQAGFGAGPLVILGVVVAYLIANAMDPREAPEPAPQAAAGTATPQAAPARQ